MKASRVRKRTFSASVISERTIQLKDEDDTNSVRNRGPEKASETTTKKTTKGKQISENAKKNWLSLTPAGTHSVRDISQITFAFTVG